MIGSEPGNIVGTTYYGQYLNNNPPTASQQYTPTNNAFENVFGSDYHVFAVEWDPFEIRFSVDGHQYLNQNVPSNGWKPAWYSVGHPQPAPFDQSFFITFNLAVGGDWAGPPRGNWPSAQSIYIDYIRVYQNSSVNVTATPVNPNAGTVPSSSSGSFGMTAIIAIVAVVVVIFLMVVALYFLYGYVVRKRALSDAPLPENLANTKADTNAVIAEPIGDDEEAAVVVQGSSRALMSATAPVKISSPVRQHGSYTDGRSTVSPVKSASVDNKKSTKAGNHAPKRFLSNQH